MKKLYTILSALLVSLSCLAQGEIISAQPEGTLLDNLYGYREGYYNYWYNPFKGTADGSVESIVVAQDGSIYLKNPVGYYPTDTWIKGTPGENDTICFQFPQKVYTEVVSGKTYDYCVYRMKKSDRSYVVDEETQVVKFTFRNNTLRKTETKCFLGLCSEDGTTWTNYGDYNIVVSPIDEATVAPANPQQAQTYLMTYTDDNADQVSRVVRVAIEGDDIYLGRFTDNQPNAWVHGTLSDGKAVFAGRTYLGVDTVEMTHTWFIPAEPSTVTNPNGYTDTGYNEQSSITFDYDATARTLATEATFIVNTGRNAISAAEAFTAPRLEPFTEVAGTPEKPVFVDYMAYGEMGNYAGIRFNLSTYSTDGHFLDPSRLFYRVYFDGEAHTFDPSEYGRLSAPMTDIPYNFSDGYDFRVSGELHTVYFYRNDLETIGVAAFYRGDDMTYPSTMVYLNLKALAGIDDLENEENATVSYTDLTGRRISQPSHGLYLKTLTRADGTRETRKVVRR